MMSKNKTCRWRLPVADGLALAIVLVLPAHASDPLNVTPHAASTLDEGRSTPAAAGAQTVRDTAAAVDARNQALFLEVFVNTARTGGLAQVELRDGALWIGVGTLRGLGLDWADAGPADTMIRLDSVPGLQARYDAELQQLWLTAPLALLRGRTQRYGFVQPEPARPDPAARVPGLIFNYDLYAQSGNGARSLSAFNELRIFGLGPGVYSNTMVSRAFRGGRDPIADRDGRGTRGDSVRLDTTWQLDFPDSAVSLAVGDAVTGALSWSRATRFGGLRLSRNFALQPYRITTPLASFQGEVALPSSVDLLIDGLTQSSQQVQPGRFSIETVPTLNGAGQAQLVITDINGQRRVLGFSLYGTPQLLQAGISDWSLDAGAVRRRYGIDSFDYDDHLMASASLRHGLSDRTTLEAHAESSAGLSVAGAGGVWRLGARGGVLGGTLAASRRDGDAGVQRSASYQWNSGVFNLFVSSLRRDADFRDVASLDDGTRLPRASDQAFIGFSAGAGQWGVSYVGQRYDDGVSSRFASLGWSRQFKDQSNFNLSVNRELGGGRGYSAFATWSVPFDRRTYGSIGARRSDAAAGLTAEIARQVPSDLGGWGWRALATGGDSRAAQAQLTHLGRHGEWSAGVDHFDVRGGSDASTIGYASASGGLVLMAGHAFAMRRVDDAFALVSTQGVADVPVKLENRLVGSTDRRGLLLINRLNAWQRNQLAIDPLQLPADMVIERTTLDAVPATRSGMLAAFPMRRVLSLQVALRDIHGAWIPAGSAVWLTPDGSAVTGAPLTVVGQDGLLYLQDPPSGISLRIRTRSGACHVTLPALDRDHGLVDLGELVCR